MCPYCKAGWHWECIKPTDSDEVILCCCSTKQQPKIIGQRTLKADEDVRDPTSTGRKRAAQLKPIREGDICEWAGLKYAGGGAVPIVGCNGRPAKARHHGPDKSTLNNEEGNLHVICVHCHNRWHAKNDPLYPKERPGNGQPFLPLSGECKPHDPNTRATIEEIFQAEVAWAEATMKEEENDRTDELGVSTSIGSRSD